MSINDSILNSVGLTDKNIHFLISDDGCFNDLTSIGHDQHLVLRYHTTLSIMFPNAQLIIDRFHIIQLALKAVQSTRINLQRNLDNHKSRIYNTFKIKLALLITDESRLNYQEVRWFRGINEFMYPQDALQLAFSILPNFKQAYDIYQAVLNSQRHRDFDDVQDILENYQLNPFSNGFSYYHLQEEFKGY